MNGSSEITQPTDAEGNVPQRLSEPNRDEPSLLIAAVNKYFPL